MKEKPITTRMVWADVARGICVLLVVLHHVVRQLSDVAPSDWTAPEFWLGLDAYLTPIRIPLFFAISGMLASSALSRPLRSTRSRTFGPAYLYVLWTFLLSLRLLVPGQTGQEHSYVSNLLSGLFLAGGGYWYLYALPLYFLACFALRRVPAWVLVMVGLGLNIAREPLTISFKEFGFLFMDEQSLIGSILANFIFFVIGARFRDLTLRVTMIASTARIGILTLSYGALVFIHVNLLHNAFVELGASLTGIVFGILISKRLELVAPVRRPLAYIGARTLPVYVSQFFFISVLSFVWARLPIMSSTPSVTQWIPWVYPLVTVAVAVVVSLVFFRVAVRTRVFRHLFEPPEWLTSNRDNR
jgi:uncharacterized membrane protein YcfT